MLMQSDSRSCAKEWFPQRIMYGEVPIVLLILNQPLDDKNKAFVKKFWKTSVFRVGVDGGASVLKEMFGEGSEGIPDLVCGDFDSATTEVLDYYRNKGVEVIHTPDQDETDFTKSLRLTAEFIGLKNLKVSAIVAIVKNGNRLDHILGNLNTLYLVEEFTQIPVFILGNESLTWLLSVGSHNIHVTKEMLDSHVGLIPLGKHCTDVTTTGLKWNLFHDKMEFGGLISTCNLFDGGNLVTVTTDTPLIWTMEWCSNSDTVQI